MGELAALSASALWAVASLIFTTLNKKASALALNFLKTSLALVMLGATLIIFRGEIWPSSLQQDETFYLALSGLIGLTLGDTCLFKAFESIGPRRTLLFSALTPPMTALFALGFLGESLTLPMLGGIALTVSGVGWVVNEGRKENGQASKAALAGFGFALLSAACQALGNVLTKMGGAHDALDLAYVRIFFGVCGISLLFAWRRDQWNSLRVLKMPRETTYLLVATILGTYLGIWLQVSGLRYASSTGVAATLSSTSPIFVLPLAAVFLHDRPSMRAILGACIAVTGVGILFLF